MPDFLGDDQRKTKPDDGNEEKIRGQPYSHYCNNVFIALYTCLALDEGDIEILKAYVSIHSGFI